MHFLYTPNNKAQAQNWRANFGLDFQKNQNHTFLKLKSGHCVTKLAHISRKCNWLLLPHTNFPWKFLINKLESKTIKKAQFVLVPCWNLQIWIFILIRLLNCGPPEFKCSLFRSFIWYIQHFVILNTFEKIAKKLSKLDSKNYRIYRLKGFKVTSCQSRPSEEKVCCLALAPLEPVGPSLTLTGVETFSRFDGQ